MPQQLGALLHTFARWRLFLPSQDLLLAIERLQQLSGAAAASAAPKHCSGATAGTGGSLAPAAAAGAAAPAAAAAAMEGLPWHPVFSPAAAAAPLDSSTRLSCLHSLGVLLQPFAAAGSPGEKNFSLSSCPSVHQQQQEQQGPWGVQTPLTRAPCMQHSAAAAHTQDKPSTNSRGPPSLWGAPGAAEVLAAGERLFKEWFCAVFRELAWEQQQQQQQQQQTNIKGDSKAAGAAVSLQPVLRIAEALANCM